jgi:hypothetical protein
MSRHQNAGPVYHWRMYQSSDVSDRRQQIKITLTKKLGTDSVRGMLFFLVGWDLRHQVLRPLMAYCTAPDDR